MCTATSVRATDVASKVSVTGRYQNLRSKETNNFLEWATWITIARIVRLGNNRLFCHPLNKNPFCHIRLINWIGQN